jgi:hypothetical protein
MNAWAVVLVALAVPAALAMWWAAQRPRVARAVDGAILALLVAAIVVTVWRRDWVGCGLMVACVAVRLAVR